MQEQIGVTKDDLDAHLQKNTHVQRMQEQLECESTVEGQKKENGQEMAEVSVN